MDSRIYERKVESMSFLEKVVSGIIDKPPFILLYGTPKIGKTTFAANAPSPIILDIEGGSNQLNVARLHPRNFAEVSSMLIELSTATHPYKTLVIDSLDHLEPMMWEAVCKRTGDKSIEIVGGGYAKGYTEALKEWGMIIDLLKKCRDKGMMIIGLAHSHVKPVNDPTKMLSYDKFELKFHHKASALFKENADMILFAHKDVAIRQDSKTKGKAVGDATHMLYTVGMPGYEAGSRYNLPAEMELNWDLFYAAFQAANPADKAKNLIALIQNESKIFDEVLQGKIVTQLQSAGEDVLQLEKIYKRVLEIKKGE